MHLAVFGFWMNKKKKNKEQFPNDNEQSDHDKRKQRQPIYAQKIKWHSNKHYFFFNVEQCYMNLKRHFFKQIRTIRTFCFLYLNLLFLLLKCLYFFSYIKIITITKPQTINFFNEINPLMFGKLLNLYNKVCCNFFFV